VDRERYIGKKMPGSLKYFTQAIEENHRARVETGASPVHTATVEYVVVKKGTPAFAAWLAAYRQKGRRTKFFEDKGEMIVPTEFPVVRPISAEREAVPA
jgi:hypothetical protein